uniref:TWiK family of potassium channels protein 7 n=1 Tax=Panagrellus redivivus TaxID=6233 RepID=A0A7E4UZL0_PANRE
MLGDRNTHSNHAQGSAIFNDLPTNDAWDLEQLLPEDQVMLDDMPTWKKYARIILPHVGLIILSLVYIIGGAFVFYHLEHPNEMYIRGANLRLIDENRRKMLRNLWLLVNNNTLTREQVEMTVIEHVDNTSRLLFDAFDTHFIAASHLRNPSNLIDHSWTMTTAIFYTTTLLTTIGYGNLVPVTFKGRMFCIFYALLGVPLILITVADIGKFLSENIVWLYGLYANMQKSSKTAPESVDGGEDRNENKEAIIGLDVSIPTSLIAIILLGYMAIGAVLLGTWENWDFFQGFYFSFITMTTVGFGDIVPVKQQFFIFDLFYIIIGLAITTMCIDLVGIQYIQKIHYFGRAIKDARYALVNVGGRMVRVPDLTRVAYMLQQKYGQRKRGSDTLWDGAYAPKDLNRIRYIDYSGFPSIESLTSFVSSILSGKSKDPVKV